ncbi:MAG: SWF/SNF helicase family protein [Coriobacteriia bacterium]|nr:SWF/SNF helicase family protein [Coriobacteriia bacterium]
MNELSHYDSGPVMGNLKDFQRRTAEYVFQRLYLDDDCTHRFLVADEVGLGKTLVAKGIVAKTVEHLWDKCPRIDIVYMCSSGEIARQNLNRLRIPGVDSPTEATRLTLLPLVLDRLELQPGEEHRVNFVSLTPATSFQFGYSLGSAEERVVLYHLIDQAWGIAGRSAPFNILHGGMNRSWFESWVKEPERRDKLRQSALGRDFVDTLQKRPDLKERWDELCTLLPRRRESYGRIPDEIRWKVAAWIRDMRHTLAQECLKALEPDLIILDEFQRFKPLLSGTDAAAQLAHELFEYSDAPDADKTSPAAVRTLLLSATPYKMYTRAGDESGDDHYSDFLDTLEFLRRGESNPADLTRLVDDYRSALYEAGEAGDDVRLGETRDSLASELRRFMVRTERLATSEDRDGMLQILPTGPIAPSATDLGAYRGMQCLAREAKQPDVMEYWKSAPYLLSYLTNYKVHREITDRIAEDAAFAQLASTQLRAGNALSLNPEAIDAYEQIDPSHARTQWLAEETIEKGLWKLLWLPPTMPYYALAEPFKSVDMRPFTKRLVFSSWAVVPRAVASLLSYEAERRMLGVDPGWGKEPAVYTTRRQRRPLRFQVKEGTLDTASLWTLVYPSRFLADTVDPLVLGRLLGNGKLASALKLQIEAERILKPHLERMLDAYRDSIDPAARSVDWYWAAPILLDAIASPAATAEWFDWNRLASVFVEEAEATAEDGSRATRRAVDEVGRLLRGELKLGIPPKDLLAAVASTGLAGPAVCGLRSLLRVAPDLPPDELPVALDAAAAIAWGFRALFNGEEAISVVRGLAPRKTGAYWRRVLSYCLAGGIQPVLDEYAHLLRETTGNAESTPGTTIGDVSRVLAAAVSLGSAQLRPQSYDKNGRGKDIALRSLFALPFNDAGDTDQKADRLQRVREAFNSPFRPFVLITTSVGQEGLDFHSYCHSVVHWNLPGNPVDLEQREGRVHRYKGHAVRKNVARRHGQLGSSHVLEGEGPVPDPWRVAFDSASEGKSDAASDLVPYWIYPEVFTSKDARVVRQVPFSPLSRDADSYLRLTRSLAIYRMVFGQARQEDLVSYLLSKMGEGGSAERIAGMAPINLEPP